MTAETWLCVNCLAIGDLTEALRCARCGSDSVVSTAKVASALPRDASGKVLLPMVGTLVGELLISQQLKTHGYLVEYDHFETFVSSREAASVEQAQEVCMNPLQAWHWVSGKALLALTPTAEAITHNDYCNWLRRQTSSEVSK